MDKIHFDLYVLSRGHLMLANRLWEDLPQGERQEPGAAHKELRNAVYRQYVAWMYGHHSKLLCVVYTGLLS
jgi:hypothetical protein